MTLELHQHPRAYAAGEVILSVEDVSLAFGGVKALTDISFDVREHEIRAIIGPNGAGNPAAKYPALRGQHARYTENQLHGFAEGKRVNENAKKMMQLLAMRMTNREIRAVASYIQGLH